MAFDSPSPVDCWLDEEKVRIVCGVEEVVINNARHLVRLQGMIAADCVVDMVVIHANLARTFESERAILGCAASRVEGQTGESEQTARNRVDGKLDGVS